MSTPDPPPEGELLLTATLTAPGAAAAPPAAPPAALGRPPRGGAPSPLTDALHGAVARLQRLASVPTPALEARRREGARQKAAVALERALRARGIPKHADTRAAVRDPSPALTPAFAALLGALRWRERRRLPSGEAPGLVVVLESDVRGCGKTVAAAWVATRWPGDALVLPADDLGSVPDTDWSAHVEVRARWQSVELLVLDDVGSDLGTGGRGTTRVAQRTGPLLLRRYNDGLVTIVTTNVPADRFIETYFATEERAPEGHDPVASLASRLSDEQRKNGCDYWYRFDGAASYRGPDGRARLAGLRRVAGDVLARLTAGG